MMNWDGHQQYPQIVGMCTEAAQMSLMMRFPEIWMYETHTLMVS